MSDRADFVERFAAYFDTAPLALALVRRPRAWPALLRSRLRRRAVSHVG